MLAPETVSRIAIGYSPPGTGRHGRCKKRSMSGSIATVALKETLFTENACGNNLNERRDCCADASSGLARVSDHFAEGEACFW